MRMTRRKKMRRKSSLRGSGPVWALKADCPLFGRGGRTQSPSHPPSFGRLIGPGPSCATRQSHWGDGKRWALTSLSPSLFLLLLPPQREEMESFSFTGNKDRSLCSFSPSIISLPFYQQPPLGDPEASFLPPAFSSVSPHSPVLLVHTSLWTPFFLLLIHHPTQWPEGLLGGEHSAKAVPNSALLL